MSDNETEVKRTRDVGKLTWFRKTSTGARYAFDQPEHADRRAAEQWLKDRLERSAMQLGSDTCELQEGDACELVRIVATVKPVVKTVTSVSFTEEG